MVELRVSRDLVADPSGHPALGRPENIDRWLGRNPDLAVLEGPRAYRVFMTVAEFPAVRSAQLRRIVGGTAAQVRRILDDFVETGLAAEFDGRYYLAELGMRRAATLSRVSPSVVRRRHGAYLEQWYREHEAQHNDGVNRLVARFAREGVAAVAGWRGEVNVPDVTQVRPDLLAPVVSGPYGGGFHSLEYERFTGSRPTESKLGPYRRLALLGRPLPVLMVCDTGRAAESFLAVAGDLPLLATTLEQALDGPISGGATVWRVPSGDPAALHCQLRPAP